MGEYDNILRYLARKHSKDLVVGLLPQGTEYKVLESIETQVTERERRLDQTLKILINNKEAILHVEFQAEWRTKLDWRIFEYHNLLAFACYDSEPKAPTPIRSVVILLSGPEKLGPLVREYRTSWDDQPFCGIRYEIEPLYKLTLAELEERQSLMWLSFAPLTVDVDEDKIKELLTRLEERFGSKREIAEVAAAMTVVGGLNDKYSTMSDTISNWIGEELIMETTLGQEFWEGLFRKRFEKEQKLAEERFKIAAEKRLEKEQKQAEERFKEEKVELVREVEEKVAHQIERKNLVELFSARLGVILTEEEEELLDGHLQRVGFSTIFRIGLNITGEKELREWLVTFDSSTS